MGVVFVVVYKQIYKTTPCIIIYSTKNISQGFNETCFQCVLQFYVKIFMINQL